MRQVPYVKTIIGDTETPITVFQKYVGDEIGFLLESKSKEKNRYSFIGTNPKNIIYVNEHEQVFEVLKSHMSQYEVCNTTKLPFMGGAVGVMGYDAAREHEGIQGIAVDVLQLPLAHFFFVTEFIAYDHDYNKILFVVIDSDNQQGQNRAKNKLKQMQELFKRPLPTIINSHRLTETYISNTSKKDFIEKVMQAKKYIQEGEISQVVISQRWKVASCISPFQLYRNLRSLNPSPYLFYFNFGDYQIVGSSPEMLVEVKNGNISTCPIAGTRKRGETDAEDDALTRELLLDPKEIKEHIMLVDLAKQDMEKVASKESIIVQDYMEIQKYSHVMHIASLVRGKQREDMDNLQILNAFFPAGTLTGAPRKRAMGIIEELEEEKRGLYGGAVGHLGCNGDMDMCIAIRMMVIKDNNVYMQAGAGIVADSDPESEYEECENKVKALMNSLYIGGVKNESGYGESY